jgi:hypothetical protein
MDYVIEVSDVVFYIDADSKEDALAEVEERLSDFAFDWGKIRSV